jgi:hypothetical protein
MDYGKEIFLNVMNFNTKKKGLTLIKKPTPNFVLLDTSKVPDF